ncbi:MAG: hypothetical protein H0W03_09660, partial [Solirubrobacterales bacterium]|nr:hypothetical protein [Solirubrobacterales bacterium]
MRAALADAVRRLRAAPGRVALAAAGIVAAAAMLGAGVTVSYGLATGFDRSAQQADLPDVLARFGDEEREDVEERVAALPNLEQRTYRYEETDVPLRANGESSDDGVIHAVRGERRGYAILEGRDVTADDLDGAVVERGVAQEWGLEVGDTISAGSRLSWEIVGIGVSPDNVAYPLASTLRIYVSGPALEEAFDFTLPVNMALLWATDPQRTDVLLQQARASSYGLSDLRFITREGVQVAVGEAAGIVIALLVAFSIVALAAAGMVAAAAMLGAGVTVSYGLATGFERSAQQADLPDVLARFGDEEREEVEERVAALPNLEQRTYRYEETGVPLRANGESSNDGVIHAVRGERRGYAILEGRDVTADDPDGAVVERGVAQEWGLEVGDTIGVGQLDYEILGIGVSPDNVAYPLASTLRIYVSGPALEEAFDFVLPVNMA